MDLDELKILLNEEDYPYFTDTYLESRIEDSTSDRSLVRELLITKSTLPAIKLGDVEISSPKDYFLMRAMEYRGSGSLTNRSNGTRIVVRADGR